jgi:hypothetical protein
MDLKSEKAKALTKHEVYLLLREYIQEQIELSQRKTLDEKSFELPSWSEYQAFQLGIQKALTKLSNLIPDQGALD